MADGQQELSGYHLKYASGQGWKYNYQKERADLERITTALGMRRGDAVLEIGCGEGFHSSVLYDLGFRVTGNELTDEGVRNARSRHPLVNYIQADSLALLDILPHDHFDMVLARGHSWWHYDLSPARSRGVDVPGNTAKMFQLVKPGGHFVLCIRTDFSGTQYADGVWNNRWQDYVDLFSPLGEITYLADSLGRPLPDDAAARASGQNIVIATRKPGGQRQEEPASPAEAPPLTEQVRKRVAGTVRKLRKRLRR